jgi:hypothetical protein
VKDERIEKKPTRTVDRESSKATVEREIKITPAREASKDKREPTPREKSMKKDERRERETKEREDENTRKRDKDEKKREKRPTSPVEFEGDLSSVSNSSTGSIQPTADVVIVEEPRGMLFIGVLFALKLNALFHSQSQNAEKWIYRRRLVSR